MKRSRFIAFILILLSAISFTAFSESAYHGYTFSFKDEASEKIALEYLNSEVSLFSEDAEMTEVFDELMIYKTASEELIEALIAEGLIESASPDYECQLFDYNYTAETGYSRQWSHTATKVQYAWDLGIYGNDVNVAVIDSGLRSTHEDFTQSNILPGYNYTITDTTNLTVDTTDTSAFNFHGTAVASVIASAVNSKGCVGVAHRANIIPIRVYGYKPSDTSYTETCLVSDLIEAISKAYYLGADVINMSLGYVGTENADMKNAINFVQRRNVIVVAAAGNLTSDQPANFDSNGNYNYAYPAAFDNVISVANIQNTSGTYSWSSSSRYNDKVTIAAPGTSIYSAYSSSNAAYASVSGTSFASPYIAGVAALAKSVKPDITQAEFTSLLISTADKSYLEEGETRNDKYGYGVVDVEALIKALIGDSAEGFISPVDRTESGAITVKIFNPGNTLRRTTFFSKTENSDGKPLGIMASSVGIPAKTAVEQTLTGLTNASTSDINCYLLDELTFEPLYQSVIG